MRQNANDKSGNFTWVDLTDPAPEELEEVISQFGLPSEMVKACLDPSHLPIFEELENSQFVLVRSADLETFSLTESDTVTELTRKIAFFITPKVLVSVHRKEQAFLAAIFNNVKTRTINHPYRLLFDIFLGVFKSYEKPLNFVEDTFDKVESCIFDGLSNRDFIKELYFLKRKVSIYKRMIRLTIDVVFKVYSKETSKKELRFAREEGDRMYSFSNELEEDVTHLLDTHLSLSANRTNDIVRVLTLFSVFFLPLTFIVGIYGMNFRFLPELEWKWGYPAVWGVMLFTCVSIFLWFRKKDWLR